MEIIDRGEKNLFTGQLINIFYDKTHYFMMNPLRMGKINLNLWQITF